MKISSAEVEIKNSGFHYDYQLVFLIVRETLSTSPEVSFVSIIPIQVIIKKQTILTALPMSFKLLCKNKDFSEMVAMF